MTSVLVRFLVQTQKKLSLLRTKKVSGTKPKVDISWLDGSAAAGGQEDGLHRIL